MTRTVVDRSLFEKWVRSAGPGLLGDLASLRVTAGLLGALLVVLAIEASTAATFGANVPRSTVLALLCVNLVASVIDRRRRLLRRLPLTLFHLTLVAIVALAIYGHMVHCTTRLDVAEGQAIWLSRVHLDRGAWSPEWVRRVVVYMERLDTTYWPGVDARPQTRSFRADLKLFVEQREIFSGEIAPNQPADHGGLHVYLTPTQGFAARFSYRPDRGQPTQGLIYFPEYRVNPDEQTQVMNVPGFDAQLRCRLHMPPLARSSAPWTLAAPPSVALSITADDGSVNDQVQMGQSVRLPGGALRFDAVPRYARIVVDYDPGAPWLLGLALLAPLTLVWHYGRDAMARARKRMASRVPGDSASPSPSAEAGSARCALHLGRVVRLCSMPNRDHGVTGRA